MTWPTTSDPKTEFATLRMTKGEANDLDTYAARAGMKRSVFVRDCVRRCIAAERRKEARLAGREVDSDG